MGSFKEGFRTNVEEIRETGKKGVDTGTNMLNQAEQIRGYLDSIHLQDDEDIQAVDETSSSYQTSFDAAYDEQVETVGVDVEQRGNEVKSAVSGEMGNVNAGIDTLNSAESVSEIGSSAAEAGISKLERSADEYEAIISDVEDTTEDVKQEIEYIKSNLSRLFG